MDQVLRDYLRLVIGVALRIAPKSVKRAFADPKKDGHDAAVRELSLSAADAVLTACDVQRRPDRFGPSAHTSFTGSREAGGE